MEQDSLLKISELAETAKIAVSTIRHYTDLGLLRVGGYTDGGHRLYAKNECLERLSRIQCGSKRGLTLPEIKAEIDGRCHIKKVLVVDDEPGLVDGVVEYLNFKFPQWQVKSAMDGFEAGRVLYEFYPDLVILDLMLPGVDGFKVCTKIRHDPQLAGVAVLAVTGFDTPDTRKKIMDCGASDYLAKPMDLKVLTEKIKKLLNVQEIENKQ